MYTIAGRVTRSTDPMFRADDIFAPPEDRGRIVKRVRTDAELAATLLRWTALGRVIVGVVPAL